MKKVLIIVDGGVADYVSDVDVDVCIFDYDIWKDADIDERNDIKEQMLEFGYLAPMWIHDVINEEDEEEEDDDDY